MMGKTVDCMNEHVHSNTGVWRATLRGDGQWTFDRKNDRSHLPEVEASEKMVSTVVTPTSPGQIDTAQKRVVAVSYLNTKPLLYGLVRSGLQEELRMDLAIPSECARRLMAGEADIALVPVAVIPELPEAHVISDYCIGCDGKVATVAIYGDVPLEEMTAIYLDHHSRTSVMLTRLLLQEYWRKDVQLLQAEEGYIERIGGTVGGLVIGDRAIGLEERFTYDLRPGGSLESALRACLSYSPPG